MHFFVDIFFCFFFLVSLLISSISSLWTWQRCLEILTTFAVQSSKIHLCFLSRPLVCFLFLVENFVEYLDSCWDSATSTGSSWCQLNRCKLIEISKKYASFLEKRSRYLKIKLSDIELRGFHCSCFLWITGNYVGKTSMKIYIINRLFHGHLAQVIAVRKPVCVVVQLCVHFVVDVNTLREVVWQTLQWLIESWIRLIY